MRIPYSTRQWKHPEGYKYLAPWTNAVLLRFLIRKFSQTLPRSEYRTKTQLDDAGRSAVSNIEEGYKRPMTKEYLDFLGFSQASLEEIKGLVKQLYQDGFLKSSPGSKLADLGIDLKEFKRRLENSKGTHFKGPVPLELLYFPLKSLKGSGLTYEMFMELINKTDWLLRQTVASLERKLAGARHLTKKYREEAEKFDEELKRIIERAKKL